jgi:hypothetical protein
MPLEQWQRIDEHNSHCSQCGDAFRNIALNDGMCNVCHEAEAQRREKILARSEARILSKATKASARLLASLKEQGKSSASLPRIHDAFMRAVGGEDAFGERMGKEWLRAHGEGLTEDELDDWSPSDKIKLQWYELILRHTSKNDETKNLDIGSLDDADLESILVDVGKRAITEDSEIGRAVLLGALQSSPELRKLALAEIEREDPELINQLLARNGIATLDQQNLPAPNKDESDYDPTEDEYED